MEVSECSSDMVIWGETLNECHCCILSTLQSCNGRLGETGKYCVTVIYSAQYERRDESGSYIQTHKP